MNNKRYALVMMVIALLFTACSENELMNSSQGKLAQVRFSVGVENQMATRAISDGSGANKLVYAIYECDEDGDEMVVAKTEVDAATLKNGEYVIENTELILELGKTYRAIFWAQNKNCTKYTISDNMEVTVDYSGLNNDDARDAFFASEEFTIDRLNFSKTFTLRRPFAQVNVGCYKYEIEMAKELGFDVKKSSAIIEDVPNKLDLKTKRTSGYVDYATAPARIYKTTTVDDTNTNGDIIEGDNEEDNGLVDVSYESASLPTASLEEDDPNKYLKVDLNDNGTIEDGEEFEYLSMCYILADGDNAGDVNDVTGRSTHNMSFRFYNENETQFVDFAYNLSAVPVQRNWRTNIVGQVLSKDDPLLAPGYSFRVVIDPGYIDDVYNNNGFYYSYDTSTEIKDKDFVFNSLNDFCYFGIAKGQTLTFENVNFSGRIGKASIGIYKIDTEGHHIVNNVNFNNLKINGYYGIENCGNYVCLGVGFYGTTEMTNCTITGTVIDPESPKNADGKYYCQIGNKPVQGTYDLCVVNGATLTINGGTFGNYYAYEQSKSIINNATINTLTTRAIHSKGSVTINGGTIKRLVVAKTSSYKPVINITNGAVIDEIVYCDGVSKEKISIDYGTVTIKKVTEGGATTADYIDPNYVAPAIP